jgi:hypothetical protein
MTETSSPGGIGLEAICAKFGWQAHTTGALMSLAAALPPLRSGYYLVPFIGYNPTVDFFRGSAEFRLVFNVLHFLLEKNVPIQTYPGCQYLHYCLLIQTGLLWTCSRVKAEKTGGMVSNNNTTDGGYHGNHAGDAGM